MFLEIALKHMKIYSLKQNTMNFKKKRKILYAQQALVRHLIETKFIKKNYIVGQVFLDSLEANDTTEKKYHKVGFHIEFLISH